ncbi:heme utilization cystosolic carrier protein HutX [Erwinia psidii]|uniref:Heme utilization cystosolic carrier protein HutX n=1 Tax=Erwinia psidii TaxID=69224 RepID=A0A3N6S3J5_9GAMM|nr:heme utilization cystosolic carrier protein HutX [Erwinia psidii]MCX8957991.1 heme utilization cystosolic carrier protein HutX [Erwinia psidii]MCX8962611.1 heme utilization cystosolic carrier protein HutX [Erwinia psidii]RQM39427.1 heme utilization cystosolic carrier protein HutX [Erwinia psidii]
MQPTLSEFMQTSPDIMLEEIARRYDVSLQMVIEALPAKTLIDGKHFDAVWDSVTRWGEVTTLVNNQDIILEFHGDLPPGRYGHGYFNLHGKQGLSGHIRANHCQRIAFVERPFMGMATASVIFLNATGEAMLKVFVGRDSHRQLLTDQLTAFRQLAESLQQGEN